MLFKWLRADNRGREEVWQKKLDATVGKKQDRRQNPTKLKICRLIWKRIGEEWERFLRHTRLEVDNGARIKFG